MFSLFSPEVDFCGYSVPHPSEKKIHIRIQTKGVPAINCFRKGLKQLMECCDHLDATFDDSMAKFEGKMDE